MDRSQQTSLVGLQMSLSSVGPPGDVLFIAGASLVNGWLTKWGHAGAAGEGSNENMTV